MSKKIKNIGYCLGIIVFGSILCKICVSLQDLFDRIALGEESYTFITYLLHWANPFIWCFGFLALLLGFNGILFHLIGINPIKEFIREMTQ